MRVRADSKSYKERGEREEETEATEQIAMLRGKVAWGEKEIAGTIDTQVHFEEFPKRILQAVPLSACHFQLFS